MDQYLNIADKLKRHVEANKGFVRSERFSSLVDERKLLSLSVWENEDYNGIINSDTEFKKDNESDIIFLQ